MQDKARKEEKRSAHMKVNARFYTKNYLMGMKEEALKELTGMGVLVAPKNKIIEKEVLPFLLNKICDFL